VKEKNINTDEKFFVSLKVEFFEFSSSLLSEYGCKCSLML